MKVDYVMTVSINLDEWEKKGEGGTADAYFCISDSAVMLKLFNKLNDESLARREFERSRFVEGLGVSTPHAYDIAMCSDGRIGIVYEQLRDKHSLSSLAGSNPSKLADYAKIFAREGFLFHKISCRGSDSLIPNRSEQIRPLIENDYITMKKDREDWLRLIDEWSTSQTLLHGDFQMGNLVTSDKGYHWIDLGSLAWGKSDYDLGTLYFVCKVLPFAPFIYKQMHMKPSQLTRFWNEFADEAVRIEEESACSKETAKSPIRSDYWTRDEEFANCAPTSQTKVRHPSPARKLFDARARVSAICYVMTDIVTGNSGIRYTKQMRLGLKLYSHQEMSNYKNLISKHQVGTRF